MQTHPKWKFHASLPAQMVDSQAAEDAIGEGWFDSPQDAADAATLAEEMRKANEDGTITEEERKSLLDLAASLGLSPHHRLGADKLLAMIEEERARAAAGTPPSEA